MHLSINLLKYFKLYAKAYNLKYCIYESITARSSDLNTDCKSSLAKDITMNLVHKIHRVHKVR